MLTRKEDEADLNRVVARLMGEEYVIRGSDDPDYLAEVASSVEARLQETQEIQPRLAKTQVAVLVALKLADELCKLHREHDELLRLLKEAK